MVEKIPVRPESVRGLGNIISPAKALEDFSVFNSKLSYVDGLYTMEYAFISVTLTSDKSILSYADGDSATLTATVLEDSSAVSGETVEFYRYVDGTNDVLLGSDVTNSNGEATYSYASAGIGDIGLYAKVRTLLTKTYDIEDCLYWNDGTKDDMIMQGSDISSIVSNGLKISTTSSSYLKAVFPTQYFSSSDNMELEFDYVDEPTSQEGFAIALYDSNWVQQGGIQKNNSRQINDFLDKTDEVKKLSIPLGSKLKLSRENGVSKFYVDDVVKYSATVSTNNFRCGVYCKNSRWFTIKNIKIKPL